MEFLHAMARVRSIDDSLRFYCDGLGLKLVRRNDYEKGRFSLLFLDRSEGLGEEIYGEGR
ncbi:MAG: VOC family protein [Robiginitomaculum sp.]